MVSDVELVRMVARAPLRTVRWADVADVVPNAARTLQRLQREGALVRIAHGMYTVPPDGADGRTWKPPVEEAGLALASARFGERRAVLMGIGAARFWGALPRALGATTVAVDVAGRSPVSLATGGIVHLVRRDLEHLDAAIEMTGLGEAMVTTPAQTLFDLLASPAQGGMRPAALEAAEALLARVDTAALSEISRSRRVPAAVHEAIAKGKAA